MKNTNENFEILIKSLQDDLSEIGIKRDEKSDCKKATMSAILACVMEMQKIYNEGC